MLSKFIRQPLLHFLVMGGLLFLIHGLVNTDLLDAEGERQIRVDKVSLLTYLQYRTKKFNATSAEEMLAGLTEGQQQELIKSFVREEVLYREAMALKLDKDDYVIRRRLTQKLEFITKGFMDTAPEPTAEGLEGYFTENKDDYYVSPHISLTHVFFSAEQRGWEQSQSAALEKLKELQEAEVSFTDAVQHGDRFLYHLNYVERVPEYIESHFGSRMAEQLFGLTPDDSRWYGPYQSAYGFHLVMVIDRREGRYPELAEIHGRVQADAHSYMVKDNVEQAINKLIDSYQIDMLYLREGTGTADKLAGVEAK